MCKFLFQMFCSLIIIMCFMCHFIIGACNLLQENEEKKWSQHSLTLFWEGGGKADVLKVLFCVA